MNNDNEVLKRILHELVLIRKAVCPFKITRILKTPQDTPLADTKLLAFITERSPVKKSAITYNLQCLGTAKDIDALLARLITEGKIEAVKRGKTTYFLKV